MTHLPLKVIHVITCLDEGGAEGALFRLCYYDKKHQHVVVSLRSSGKYGPLLKKAGIPVYLLEMPAGKVTFSGLAKLWRLLRVQSPDVVQTWLYHCDLIGGLLGRLAGVPHIVWGIRHSNLTPGTIKRSTRWIAHTCAAFSRYVPSSIVCCSIQAAAAHVQLGYAQEKVRIIPNGYDLTQLRPDPLAGAKFRAELNLPSGKPLIGMVARFDVQKDHANFIAALAQLKQLGQVFHCLLVGGGMTSDNTELVKMLLKQGVSDHVTMLGRRNDIAVVMNALDVHVLSSLGEAFPNVLAEAMACGTPCVTTDVGDAAYIVGETGWVVPAQDSNALADGIAAALMCFADQSRWVHHQRAARLRIETNFTIERMVGLFDQAWHV
jgi:glycosyltransferase involved in cell wall biosynthesis